MGTRRKDIVTTQQNSYLQLDSVPPTLLQSHLECPDKHFPGSGKNVQFVGIQTWNASIKYDSSKKCQQT